MCTTRTGKILPLNTAKLWIKFSGRQSVSILRHGVPVATVVGQLVSLTHIACYGSSLIPILPKNFSSLPPKGHIFLTSTKDLVPLYSCDSPGSSEASPGFLAWPLRACVSFFCGSSVSLAFELWYNTYSARVLFSSVLFAEPVL